MQEVAQYTPQEIQTKVRLLPTARAGQGKRYSRAYLHALADKMIQWYAENQAQPKDIRHILLKRFLASEGHTFADAEEFAKEYTYFARSLQLAKQWQEVLVIEHGLSESKGQTTAALVLKNNHGYEEKTSQSTKDEKVVRLIVQGVGKRKLKDVRKVLEGVKSVLPGDNGEPGKKANKKYADVVEAKVENA